jgi:hypothetical protein
MKILFAERSFQGHAKHTAFLANPEATIVRLILRQILTWESRASSIFRKNRLNEFLFDEIQRSKPSVCYSTFQDAMPTHSD